MRQRWKPTHRLGYRLQHYTSFLYNADGQPLYIADHLSNLTEFRYNSFGDLITVLDPLGNTTTREVDGVGRLTKLTAPLKQSTRYEYDPLNRLKKVTDPLGGITSFTYDPNGNLLSVKDAKNQTTSYTYDLMDRLVSRTDPLTRSETYQYDANSNLTRFTDRKTQATTFTYDLLNRRTKMTFADTTTITYTYDQGKRLTQANDSLTGAVLFSYDALDRMVAEGTNREIIGYSYDKAGRRTSMNMVVGGQVRLYVYDIADRLTAMIEGLNSVSFFYDNANQRTQVTLQNGITMDYRYDNASRLTALTYKKDALLLGNLTYSYDANGQRTAVGGSLARTGIPASRSGTTYDAANKMRSFGAAPLNYDNNGNLTSDGTDTFIWNARNQLAAMSGPGLTASFSYDALGRRIQKTLNGQSLSYAHDGVNIVEELTGASVTARMITGLGVDELFTRIDASGTRHLFADALGSTIALTDPAGVTQTQYTYEPFGETTVTGTANANPSQFTGRENDGTTDLYYYRARYYHPTLQRFISEDPIGFAGGDVNLYAYVGNDPVNLTDPSGERFVAPFPPGYEVPPECRAPDLSGRKDLGLLESLGNQASTFFSNLLRTLQCDPLIDLFPGGLGIAKIEGAFERQLAKEGVKSLEKSLRSLEANLTEHLRKLEEIRAAGGFTSSVEREIRTFQAQIDAIKKVLGR